MLDIKLKRTDVKLLTYAYHSEELGIQSHHHSAAARRRMLKAGFVFESDVKIIIGQYRSTIRIQPAGRDAIYVYFSGAKPCA